MQYIGKLDKLKLGYYADKITTDNVVLTNERKYHILENHENDYKLIINNLERVILNPNKVIEDLKNKDTIFLISKLGKNNLNVIVKLNTTNNKKHPQNSIMTAWIIRNRNVKKIIQKNKILYKNE